MPGSRWSLQRKLEAAHLNGESRAVHLMIVCRCLERIADHATNIAEDVIFMVDALVIKHHADIEGDE
jgi:phosphate uptake regulator